MSTHGCNLDEPWKHDAGSKKPNTKVSFIGFLLQEMSGKGKSRGTESRLPETCEQEMGSNGVTGIECS